MSLHPMHTPHTHPRRSRLAILCAFTVALGVGAIGLAYAAAPDPADAAPAAPAVPDVVTARAALAAIDADPELKGVNLVVSVVDRVAVVGGPVNSAAQARRVEQVVRSVPGITDVRNNCFVSLGPDPLLKAVSDRLGSSLPPRPVMVDLPGVLTGSMPPAAPPPVSNATFAAGNPPAPVTVRKPGADLGVLGAPVGPAGKGAASSAPAVSPAVPGVLTGTTPAAPADPGGALAAASAVRKTEARFANLTVELQGGTLVIGGSAPKAADAWDFAQKLRTVPGVTRVAVGAVAVK
jgi:hypothetical protein